MVFFGGEETRVCGAFGSFGDFTRIYVEKGSSRTL